MSYGLYERYDMQPNAVIVIDNTLFSREKIRCTPVHRGPI